MKKVNELEFWMVYNEHLKFCHLTVTENYLKGS